MGKKGAQAAGVDPPPKTDPGRQQAAGEQGVGGSKQLLVSVQALNESMDSVRNYMLTTNCEMSQEITLSVSSAMTEFRDANLHFASSIGHLTDNMNAMSLGLNDLIAMMKEERKGKGQAELPPQQVVMPHFGVFNGLPGQQTPKNPVPQQHTLFQASSSRGLAQSGV